MCLLTALVEAPELLHKFVMTTYVTWCHMTSKRSTRVQTDSSEAALLSVSKWCDALLQKGPAELGMSLHTLLDCLILLSPGSCGLGSMLDVFGIFGL